MLRPSLSKAQDSVRGFQLPIIMISATLQMLNKKKLWLFPSISLCMPPFHFHDKLNQSMRALHLPFWKLGAELRYPSCRCPAKMRKTSKVKVASWSSAGHYWKKLSKIKRSVCPVEVSRYCSRKGHHLPPYFYVSFELYPSELKDRSSLSRRTLPVRGSGRVLPPWRWSLCKRSKGHQDVPTSSDSVTGLL